MSVLRIYFFGVKKRVKKRRVEELVKFQLGFLLKYFKKLVLFGIDEDYEIDGISEDSSEISEVDGFELDDEVDGVRIGYGNYD